MILSLFLLENGLIPMTKDVKRYFEDIAVDFDSYYESPSNPFSALINAWLRRPGLLKRLKISIEMTELNPGKRILDIGCGSGKYVVECAKCGAEVTGIDISEEMIRLAKQFGKQNGVSVTFEVGDATKNLPTGFDVITALGVFEYFKDPGIILDKMIESINDDGQVIFSVPKLFTFQYPLRELMLKWRGVKCYYYTKNRIMNILKNYDGEVQIYDYGPGYVVSIKKIMGKVST